MNYPLENLTPEKFQQFAQALLTKEFPNVQCFPVAQPDGGRDAMQMRFYEGRASFVMFQVKFVRTPESNHEPHKWLLSIIENEAPKVKKQLREGVKQYVLITNVSGTAHPDSGSIDIANKTLTQALGIPSVCWWRDDLCRRLDSSWDLKWAYPELMTGPDLIRYVIENGLSEAKERRANAVRAFIKDQYSIDKEVKFKQIELQNQLLDLFVDVPIGGMVTRGPRGYYRARVGSIEESQIFYETSEEVNISNSASPHDLEYVMPHGRVARYRFPGMKAMGAGHFLLQPNLWDLELSRVVLEGAPGHGKSTIVQYVCQVHRMRLLEIQEKI